LNKPLPFVKMTCNYGKRVNRVASIQKKNKEGTKWLLIVSDGYNGKKQNKVTKIFYGTDKQAMKAAILFEEEVKNGKYRAASKDYKLSKFVEMWIDDYGKKYLEPKTLSRYIEMLETRILPAIGNIRLDKLKPMVINRFMVELADMPRLDKKPGKLSARTVKHHYGCLSAILQDAADWEIISENPCKKVKSPKTTKAKVKVYDENETAAFLTALEKAPLKHRTLIWLEIATGVREGEMMGLAWPDFDFDKSTVRVERASQYLPEKGVFEKDTKTEESRRTMALPNNVMALLKQYRAEWNEKKLKLGNLWQVTATTKSFAELLEKVMPGGGDLLEGLRDNKGAEKAWKENVDILLDRGLDEGIVVKLDYLGIRVAAEISALCSLTDEQLQEFVILWHEKQKTIPDERLFTTWDGCPGSTYWPGKWLTKFLKDNELPHCSFHSLRHLNATMLIKSGISLKNVSARLGHTVVGTTTDIYAEALESVDREAAEKLGTLLKNKPKDKDKKKKRRK